MIGDGTDMRAIMIRFVPGQAIGGFPQEGVRSDDPSSLVGLGLWSRPQDRIRSPALPGLGFYEIEDFDPGAFRPYAPYIPLETADRFDAFWGAKLLIRLRPEHLRALVEDADYAEPRTTEYLTRALIARQRATARYWFRRVNPLDDVTAAGRGERFRLCFTDLTVAHRLERDAVATRYQARLHDHGGERLPARHGAAATASGRVCLGPIAAAPGRDHYTIVAVDTRRAGSDYQPLLVHVARAPDGTFRVIGLRRQ